MFPWGLFGQVAHVYRLPFAELCFIYIYIYMFSLVGLKGNRYHYFFPGGLSKWKQRRGSRFFEFMDCGLFAVLVVKGPQGKSEVRGSDCLNCNPGVSQPCRKPSGKWIEGLPTKS